MKKPKRKNWYARAGLRPAPIVYSLDAVESRTHSLLPRITTTATIYFRVEYRSTMVDAVFMEAGTILMYNRRPHWETKLGCLTPLDKYKGRYYLSGHGRP